MRIQMRDAHCPLPTASHQPVPPAPPCLFRSALPCFPLPPPHSTPTFSTPPPPCEERERKREREKRRRKKEEEKRPSKRQQQQQAVQCRHDFPFSFLGRERILSFMGCLQFILLLCICMYYMYMYNLYYV